MFGAMKEYLEDQLQQIRQGGLYKNERVITTPQRARIGVLQHESVLNLCANNYLGLADHPDVAECAVLGVDDSLKGQVPVGFLVLNAGVDRQHDEIIAEVIKMVRERIGPVASFKTATVVKRLPKTRSGKILRGTIQKIADNQEYKTPATIDDPTILGEIEEALEGIGYASARK